MPGFTTHYLFGVRNLKQLKRSGACHVLTQSIDSHRAVFQLGLQGPDVFFYHLASQLKPVRPGSVAHTRWTGDFLKCLMESPTLFLKEEERQAAQAYAAGFIGHYVLDTQMHPYVYARTGIGDALKEKGYADHIGLESDIDACLLMRYAKRLPSEFPYGKTIAFGAKARSVVSDVLFYAYDSVFPELGLTRRFLSRAIRSMQIGTRLTYNPHNYKRQVLEKIERVIFGHPQISPVIPSDFGQYSEDPLNLGRQQWQNPWDPKECFHSSVPELIKKASGRYQKALRQLGCLYAADPFASFEPHDPYNACNAYAGQYDVLLERLCQFLGQQSFHSGLDWILGE